MAAAIRLVSNSIHPCVSTTLQTKFTLGVSVQRVTLTRPLHVSVLGLAHPCLQRSSVSGRADATLVAPPSSVGSRRLMLEDRASAPGVEGIGPSALCMCMCSFVYHIARTKAVAQQFVNQALLWRPTRCRKCKPGTRLAGLCRRSLAPLDPELWAWIINRRRSTWPQAKDGVTCRHTSCR